MWSDSNSDQNCFFNLETTESNEFDPIFQNKNFKKDNSTLNKKFTSKNQSPFTLNYDQSLNSPALSFSPNNDYTNQLLDQMICNYNYLSNEFSMEILEKKKNVQNKLSSSNSCSVSPATQLNNLLLKQSMDSPKSLFDWNTLLANNKEKQCKFLKMRKVLKFEIFQSCALIRFG